MIPAYLLLLSMYCTTGATSSVMTKSVPFTAGSFRVQKVAIWFSDSSESVSEPRNRHKIVVIPAYEVGCATQDFRPVHFTVSTWAASSTLSDLFFIRHSYAPASNVNVIVSASSSPVPAVLLYSYAVQAEVPILRHSIDSVTVLSSYFPLLLRYPSPAGKSISTSYSEALAPIGHAR